MAGGNSTKRMSADEKRQTILQIYHKTKSVYTEKEIVTLASKAGVNANTIVDVNNSLIDDGLVDKEKIGGSNYYWSFPAKKDRQLQVKHQETLQEIENTKAAVEQATLLLLDAKRGREDDEEGSRAKKLARLQELEQTRTKLETELASLKENDPQALADLQQELVLCQHAANRWTDNIFECQSYLVKKRGMDKKEVNKILGITSTFDYPEDKIPK